LVCDFIDAAGNEDKGLLPVPLGNEFAGNKIKEIEPGSNKFQDI
jgi:hypothetical protein